MDSPATICQLRLDEADKTDQLEHGVVVSATPATQRSSLLGLHALQRPLEVDACLLAPTNPIGSR